MSPRWWSLKVTHDWRHSKDCDLMHSKTKCNKFTRNLSTSRPRQDRAICTSRLRWGETFGFWDRGKARHFKSLTRDCFEARQLSQGLHHCNSHRNDTLKQPEMTWQHKNMRKCVASSPRNEPGGGHDLSLAREQGQDMGHSPNSTCSLLVIVVSV